MQTPRAWIEAYSRSLNDISDTARAELERRLAALDWKQDVATIREQVVTIMQPCCGASTTMAARLAADFYDGLRERSGVRDGFRAVIDPCREPEATEGAVRAFAQDLVDGKPVEQFVGKCSDRLDRETRLAANKCVEANARRDPKGPRWARVPTGFETCEFCIMLASRGFVYRSEDVASHAHANCDCRVVPSWDKEKAEVEGYDPDYYRDCYRHPEDHPEIRDAINARRRELYAMRKDDVKNVLGSGSGGNVKGEPYLLKDARFDPNNTEQVAQTLQWCRDAIRNEPVENALIMTATGEIWHSIGVVDAVNLAGVPLDGATVIHNHPEEADGGSFGSDDYKFLRDHPELHELWAVTESYNYCVRLLASKRISYGEAYARLSIDAIDDDYKHSVMEWLHEHGYVDYQRTSV